MTNTFSIKKLPQNNREVVTLLDIECVHKINTNYYATLDLFPNNKKAVKTKDEFVS